MCRYFIQLAFDGTQYHGWQIQKNANSIQEELQKALTVLFRKNIEVTGCGRTDTGVHAREFYAHFDYDGELSEEDTIFRLNALLPSDIGVYNVFRVNNKAHTRFSATARVYHYCVSLKKDPFLINKAWFFYRNLDVNAMNRAANILFDYEDFTSFSKSHTQVKTNICDIMEARWIKKADKLLFVIKANRFLRNMVRAIVGTLVEVGQGKMDEKEMHAIIQSKDRSRAGASVPAAGLYLTNIEYPKDIKDLNE